MHPPQQFAAPPLRPHPRRRWLIWVSTLLAVAVAATVGVVLYVNNGPARTVERYLSALLERDVHAALVEVSPDSLPGAEELKAFLVPDAMRTDWSFDSVRSGERLWKGRETVTAELSGMGTTEEATFELESTDDGWRIVNPFAKVTFEQSPLTYSGLDGVRLPIEDVRSVDEWSYPVFPGAHRFYDELPDGLEAVNRDSLDRLLVPGGGLNNGGATVAPEFAIEGDMLDQGRGLLQEVIDGCAESDWSVPQFTAWTGEKAECPFRAPSDWNHGDGDLFLVADTLEWTVVEYPEFDFSLTSDQYDVPVFGGVVQEDGLVHLTAEGTLHEGLGDKTAMSIELECAFAPLGFSVQIDHDDRFLVDFTDNKDGTRLGTDVNVENPECDHVVEEA